MVRKTTSKKPMSNKKFLGIGIPVVAIIAVLAIVANVAINMFHGPIETYLGSGRYTAQNSREQQSWDSNYYPKKFNSIQDAMKSSTGTIDDIAEEGMVLLKNDGALPMNATNVTLLGRGSADPIYGGTGSGHTKTNEVISIKDSLEQSGYTVNPTIFNELSKFAKEHPAEKGGRISISYLPGQDKSIYRIGEMPVSNYSKQALDSLHKYDGAGIVTIGRVGGEGGDLIRDMKGWDDNYTPGQHILQLNKDEKDQIAFAKQHFAKVIVLINASTSMELGELQDDPRINAILETGAPGATGFKTVGKILKGELNPSGKTVDLFARDFTKDPTFVNFGNNEYSNDSKDAKGYFVNYEEGIYHGYRYYETAAKEGFINYRDAVVYPFGYGLSFTSFNWQIVKQELGNTGGKISVDVKVTNTGKVAGKDVVQLYYTAPYTKGGIEKSSVILGDFTKTKQLEPGASQTVALSIPVQDMASYDYRGAKSYVLDKGTYEINLQTDSHNLKQGVKPINYTVDQTITYAKGNARASDKTAATNEFDDVSAPFINGQKTTLSRADFAGTFPKAPDDADKTAPAEVLAKLKPYDAKAANAGVKAKSVTTDAKNDITLAELRGRDYKDPLWNKFLDQFSSNEMKDLVLTGAYRTSAISRLGKPSGLDFDGPAGFSSFINTSIYGSAFPTAVLIGQTWNRDLGNRIGQAIGNEALALGINGWYAPAVNIHRSPFAGRNFEYYSEDPVLSGVLATQVVDGAGSRGVYAFTKHFALNDQETNRDQNGLCTWADEQTIREDYLKPFEIVVKNAKIKVPYLTSTGKREVKTIGPTGIMSSFNRIGATWTGGSRSLISGVLRGEWGFTGMVVTDMAALGKYMSPDWAISAGNDLQLNFSGFSHFADGDSSVTLNYLRDATHNILYTFANSNALNGYAPKATLQYHPAFWEYAVWVVSGLIALLLVGIIVWMVLRVRRHRDITANGAKQPIA